MTTKAQERKDLEQIKKIVESLGGHKGRKESKMTIFYCELCGCYVSPYYHCADCAYADTAMCPENEEEEE